MPRRARLTAPFSPQHGPDVPSAWSGSFNHQKRLTPPKDIMSVTWSERRQLTTSASRPRLHCWIVYRSLITYGNHPMLSLLPQGHVLAWWWTRLHKVRTDADGQTGRMDADGWMLYLFGTSIRPVCSSASVRTVTSPLTSTTRPAPGLSVGSLTMGRYQRD